LSLIALIALKFGPLAAAVGTLVSAATFAMYLFKPFHSLRVDDPIARNNLIWMVLLGLIAAHFLPPPRTRAVTRASLRRTFAGLTGDLDGCN
jgi:K+-sensing histidine kinase KdpD